MNCNYYLTEKSTMTGEIVTWSVEKDDLLNSIADVMSGKTMLISLVPCDMPEPMKCKYYKRCTRYDKKATVCNKTGGGSYCGEYRRKEGDLKQ